MSKLRWSLTMFLAAVVLALAPGAAGSQSDPQPGHPTYLHLSDIHFDRSGASSDTDPQLWAITKARLASILDGPDAPAFVLYTGDLPGHSTRSDCARSDCAHNANIRTVLSDLHDLVADTGIPLLYLPGNNDSLAGDYFSFTDRAGKTPLSLVPDDHYPAVHASTPCGRPPCTVSTPDPGLGFYSVRPVEGLRVIALNTIVLGRKYHAVDGTAQLEAGNAEMEWLARELADADGKEKVLIAMHIPPGNDAYAVYLGKTETWMWARHPDGVGGQPRCHMEHWLDRFLDLVAAHRDAVVGLAYGHTHMDELRRLHDRAGRVIEIAVSAPGITTDHGNNPGFKRVTYDRESKELLDFTTLYTEEDSTSWGDQQYRFSTRFGCAGETILGCLTGDRYNDTAAIDAVMRKLFTVMNDPPSPSHKTSLGIEVRHGQ